MLPNIPQLKLGDILRYHPSDILLLSNHTSTTISLYSKFNSRWEKILWLLQKNRLKYLFVHKVVPENTKKKTSQPAKSKLFVNTAKYLKDNQHNSHYFFQKYACIFVLRHYLFLETHSFHKLSSHKTICTLEQAISAVKISVHIFAPNKGYCLFRNVKQ